MLGDFSLRQEKPGIEVSVKPRTAQEGTERAVWADDRGGHEVVAIGKAAFGGRGAGGFTEMVAGAAGRGAAGYRSGMAAAAIWGGPFQKTTTGMGIS